MTTPTETFACPKCPFTYDSPIKVTVGVGHKCKGKDPFVAKWVRLKPVPRRREEVTA